MIIDLDLRPRSGLIIQLKHTYLRLKPGFRTKYQFNFFLRVVNLQRLFCSRKTGFKYWYFQYIKNLLRTYFSDYRVCNWCVRGVGHGPTHPHRGRQLC